MRYYYDYNEFLVDTKALVGMIDWEFDAIVAIARGGLTMGHFLGEYYDTRDVYGLNTIGYEDTQKLETTTLFNIPDLSKKARVLIVDDICDSGDTLQLITQTLTLLYPHCQVRTATLFYKTTASFKPDWSVKEATKWIDFFWSVDIVNLST